MRPVERAEGSSLDAGSSLLDRARGGDRAALDALWESHRRWVAVVLLAHKPAEVDLEDLLQDVAMTLVTRLSDLRDDASFRAWLRMIAVNAARAAARSAAIRRMKRLAHPDEESMPIGEGAGRHTSGERLNGHALDGASRGGRDEALRLLELSMQLPPEYREPLLLKSLHDLTYRQIAAMLDLPDTTVETRITRGRRMLREIHLSVR